MSPRESKINVYAPVESYEKINAYIDSAYLMTLDINDPTTLKLQDDLYTMNPVSSPMKISCVIKKKNFDIEIIQCHHSVPCVGYGLIEKRIKLKEEYVGLSGKDIGALKKSGVDINYEQEVPLFLYLGDTSHKVLEESAIEKYRTVMIECTFILDEDLEQAATTQHMHWSQLAPYVANHPNTTFVVYHFSQRYKPAQILEFFDELALDNVLPWVSS
jgi:ribonuclease Z